MKKALGVRLAPMSPENATECASALEGADSAHPLSLSLSLSLHPDLSGYVCVCVCYMREDWSNGKAEMVEMVEMVGL